jgi:cobalt-zinc-cadmium efflux system membrane fusion protein
MRRPGFESTALFLCLSLFFGGCGQGKGDPKAEAPPPAKVEHEEDVNVVQVDHPERFPLATAAPHAATSQLVATGVVSPDVSRTVPVVSLASGRVLEIHARLGDTVKKGQLLLRIQSSDISAAFADYRKAVTDEALVRTQFERAKLLYDKGAISLNDFQVAQDTEDKAKVDVETAADRLRVLGGNLDQPAATVDVLAPASGVIVEQNVAASAGVKSLDNSPNLFTIADLSSVWILCDVYENDLPSVHLGETAEIRLNAYPNSAFSGRISNISPILDPSIRTAKVRIEVRNSGIMKVGMFVSATFHGQKEELRAAVPASAILHLHDRDWVYVPTGDKQFRRVEVVSGEALSNGLQEIVSGIQTGQRVVANALVLQSTTEQ